MAERRMFTQKITESDAFLDMPMSSQALYFHFCMCADDDGFVKNPRRIQRMIGASDDDFKILIAKSFVIIFEKGIIVIKHWRMHNLLRKDRYVETEYIDEKQQLYLKGNGAYTLDPTKGESLATKWQPNDNQMTTEDSIGKVSIGEISLGEERIGKDSENTDAPAEPSTSPPLTETKTKSKRFVKPTVDEIKQFCAVNGYNVDAEYFYDYYEGNGWKVGKNPMKDWRATVRNWERNNRNNPKPTNSKSDSKHDLFQRLYEEAAENDRKRNG